MAFLVGTDPGLRKTKTPTVDTFAAGVGFTAGSSTTVALSDSPGTEEHLTIFFDGVGQHRSTYSLSGSTVTFDTAIPTGVAEVEATYAPAVYAQLSTVGDNEITLAKMAGGTDGNIISYDASGNPVAIATGTDGQVLTSAGAGQPCAFEDAGGTSSLAIYTDQEAAGSSAGDDHAINGFRTVVLNTEVLDADGIGALSSNAVTLAAGTYRIECWSQASSDAATFSHVFGRIRDTTNSTTLVVGTHGVATGDSGVTASSSKVAYIKGQFTLSGTAAFEYQVYPVGATFNSATGTTNTGEVNIAALVYLEKI